MAVQVTKNTNIGELLEIDIDAAAPVLMSIGMHCLGCRLRPFLVVGLHVAEIRFLC